MKKLIYFLLFSTLLVNTGCPGDDEEPGPNSCSGKIDSFDARLLATYNNPAGGQPSLVVHPSNSSPEINVEVAPIVNEQNGRITFNYPGVTFKRDNNVYSIDEVTTERKSGNCWIDDDENFLQWTFSKSLDIVLVLDVSSSLSENIATIKVYAKQMVSNVLAQNPDVNVAVVKFSRGYVALDFTSDKAELENFIEQNTPFTSTDIGTYDLEGRSETGLYEAINQAIQLLISSNARGKGILTFTDGVSNYQIDPQFQNPTNVINALSSVGIANYTIGFEGNQGGVDKTALKDISVNGDFSFPQDLVELQNVFSRFSNSVAAVYDLIYNTNNGKLQEEVQYRFLFNTTLISR